MSSLGSSNLNALNTSCIDSNMLNDKEYITIKDAKLQKQIKVAYESHTFHCMRFVESPADKGFTDNLNNFLLDIIKNPSITDENIKLIASKFMEVCVHHEVKYWDANEIARIQQQNKDKEDLKKANEI
jgi:hypothetical protein